MKFIITVLMIGLLISCTKPKRTPYLTYTADSFNVNNVELYRLDNNYTLFDQAEREPESMIWSFRSDSVPGGIYQLRINKNKKITLILEGKMPVGIELQNGVLTITGNEPTKQLWEAQTIADQLNQSILSLGESFPDSLESTAFVHHKDSIFKLVELQKEKAQKKILQIIDHNKHTLLPLLLVQLKQEIIIYSIMVMMPICTLQSMNIFNPIIRIMTRSKTLAIKLTHCVAGYIILRLACPAKYYPT